MIKIEELIPSSGFQLENHLALASLHKGWEVQSRMGDSPAENKLPRDQGKKQEGSLLSLIWLPVSKQSLYLQFCVLSAWQDFSTSMSLACSNTAWNIEPLGCDSAGKRLIFSSAMVKKLMFLHHFNNALLSTP